MWKIQVKFKISSYVATIVNRAVNDYSRKTPS